MRLWKEGEMSETRILVADDSEEGRVGILRLLETVDAGYDIRLAANGRAALQAVTDDQPHVLIAATFLRPGPAGIELCARIRRAPRLKYMGVALLAPDLRSKARALALSGGADLVLVPHEVRRTLPLKLPGLVECAYERKGERLRRGEILMCPEIRRAWVGDRVLDLSPVLLRALQGLLSDPGGFQTFH